MNLRQAAQQALEALFFIRDGATGLYGDDLTRCNRALEILSAALEPVTDCHGLEQARSVAISNLLTHFGITSEDSNVNVAYIHKQLDDFLMAAIGCNREKDKLAPPFPTVAVHVGYRYQSPVGGWEYGDHIPAGFDTNKWAHQKIYILQEQA